MTDQRIIVFDLETNGLLDKLDRIHVMVAQVVGEEEQHTFIGSDIDKAGLPLLDSADVLVAHNLIGFDLAALKKVCDWSPAPHQELHDTLVMSRVMYRNMADRDGNDRRINSYNTGRHTLESWGLRMGFPKAHYDGGWDTLTPEMISYCQQDVRVLVQLYKGLRKLWDKYDVSRADTEVMNDLAFILREMGTKGGFRFNRDKAAALNAELVDRLTVLREELEQIPGWWKDKGGFTPKRNDRSKGYIEDVDLTKVEWHDFNPGSRADVIHHLKTRYGWQPVELTENGNPKMNAEILQGIDIEEIQPLAEYWHLSKILAYLSTGDKNWIAAVKDGYVRCRYNSDGTVTGRASHSHPNLAQVPSKKVQYGVECRQLFEGPQGWHMMGADLKGLELRLMGHFMHEHDPTYVDILLDGDIHEYHQKSAGLDTRDMAKTFIYAMIYGAGGAKLSSIISADGAKAKRSLLKNVPALKNAQDDAKAEAAANDGYLVTLDHTRIPTRSDHSAFNFKLQGAGAVICKHWVVETWRRFVAEGWVPWEDFKFLAWVHDELQLAFRDEKMIGRAKEILQAAARTVGERFNLNVPMDVDTNVGQCWAETH